MVISVQLLLFSAFAGFIFLLLSFVHSSSFLVWQSSISFRYYVSSMLFSSPSCISTLLYLDRLSQASINTEMLLLQKFC